MKEQIYNTLDELLSSLDSREADVIKKRFGINSQPLSLEKIGKDYSITRERVRQIQNSALSKMIRRGLENSFLEKNFYPEIDELLGKLKIKREIYVLKKLKTIHNITSEEENIIKLFLFIHSKIFYEKETQEFFAHLSTVKEILEKAKKILYYINTKLKSSNELFKEEELLNILEQEIKKHLNLDPDLEDLLEFIKISKLLKKNPLNELGYFEHPRIAPGSLNEKIKIILEIEGKPMHFLEIWEKLKTLSQIEDELLHPEWKKSYNMHSVHNVLILDSNFIKYGRGKYALKAWGYNEGHIIDLMKKIVEERKQIGIDELYKLVKEQREVSDQTFKIYLYKYFKVKNKIVTLKDA